MPGSFQLLVVDGDSVDGNAYLNTEESLQLGVTVTVRIEMRDTLVAVFVDDEMVLTSARIDRAAFGHGTRSVLIGWCRSVCVCVCSGRLSDRVRVGPVAHARQRPDQQLLHATAVTRSRLHDDGSDSHRERGRERDHTQTHTGSTREKHCVSTQLTQSAAERLQLRPASDAYGLRDPMCSAQRRF